MSERVLVVAAHPDDEVLGCGGVIVKYRALNVPVRVVFLAEGVTSRYSESELNLPHVLEAQKRRNDNAYRALEVLKVPKEQVFVNERHCCRLDQVPLLDLVKQIEFHISEWNPTRLFTHAPYDTNVDHGLVYKAVLAATRPVNNTDLKAIYSFEILSSTEWNYAQPFQPNVFFDISEFIDLKVKALLAYEDEMMQAPHPRSETVLRSLARVRGSQVGVNYAEGFNLVRLVEL